MSRIFKLRALAIVVSLVLVWPADRLFGQSDVGKPGRRALLVGISKYSRGSSEPNKDWWNLNTEQDIRLLKEMLIKKFEFEEKDIKVLILPQETTHKAILDAFRTHLIAQTRPGDIIFFHFSGHGQQIPDDDRDEIDGMDESLVPSDYISQQDGSKNIRDDEIGVLLEELKAKRPANVTVTLDSCYSGTGTRGEFVVRGGPWKGAPVPKERIRGEETSASGLPERGLGKAEGYVFISAASPRQTAKETLNEANQSMGLFTWALVKSMEAAGPTTTYRDMFERINDLMTRNQGNQNPQLEGELDKVLMAGTALKPERYIGIRTDQRKNVFLLAGKLQGMTKGSRFAIYPEGTKSTADGGKLADAEIIDVDVTTSVLKLSAQVAIEKLRTARAFETRHYYDETLLKVATQNLEKLSAGKDIQQGIKSFELAESVTRGKGSDIAPFDVLIHPPTPKDLADRIVAPDFKGVIMERQNGTILATVPEGPQASRDIKTALEREMRWLTVKSLENTDPSIKIELRVVSVEVEVNPATQKVRKVLGDKMPTMNSGNQMEMAVGDHIMLEVRNIGDEPAYVTILNLRSDGLVGPTWPQQLNGIPAQINDNFIKNDGKWHRIGYPYVFVLTEPLGLESFRAIATREPTDFTPLIDENLPKDGRRGDQTEKERNATDSPLGRILLANRKGGRRGPELAMDIPPAWATANVSFIIRQK